jgi:hypothetical protein
MSPLAALTIPATLQDSLIARLGRLESADHHAKAEPCCHQALTIARCQHAKAWEQRAATSLSHLWQRQGKRAAAREVLAEAYGWFTEGCDTADLREARAILAALS